MKGHTKSASMVKVQRLLLNNLSVFLYLFFLYIKSTILQSTELHLGLKMHPVRGANSPQSGAEVGSSVQNKNTVSYIVMTLGGGLQSGEDLMTLEGIVGFGYRLSIC